MQSCSEVTVLRAGLWLPWLSPTKRGQSRQWVSTVLAAARSSTSIARWALLYAGQLPHVLLDSVIIHFGFIAGGQGESCQVLHRADS